MVTIIDPPLPRSRAAEERTTGGERCSHAADNDPRELDPGVVRVIRLETLRASTGLRRFGLEPEDVQQELLLRVLECAGDYDHRRSSWPTFASRVCHSRKLQIIEYGSAAKRGGGHIARSLSEPLLLSNGDEQVDAELEDVVSEDQCAMRAGRRSRPTAELISLCIDVDRVVGQLPVSLAEVAHTLMTAESLGEAARQLRISRATLHRRIVVLRDAFRAAGLDRYMGTREAA